MFTSSFKYQKRSWQKQCEQLFAHTIWLAHTKADILEHPIQPFPCFLPKNVILISPCIKHTFNIFGKFPFFSLSGKMNIQIPRFFPVWKNEHPNSPFPLCRGNPDVCKNCTDDTHHSWGLLYFRGRRSRPRFSFLLLLGLLFAGRPGIMDLPWLREISLSVKSNSRI